MSATETDDDHETEIAMNAQFATNATSTMLCDIPKNIVSSLQMNALKKNPPVFGPKVPASWQAEVKASFPGCGIFDHKANWIAAIPNPEYKVPVLLQTSGGVKTNPAWSWDEAHIVLSVGPLIGDKTPKPDPTWVKKQKNYY